MRFHFSARYQILAVMLALTLLVCSPGWAGDPALSPAEQVWLKAHPVIRMSVDVGYGPYTFLDAEGHLQGVAADFFADIERLLGIRFEIISNLSWTQQMEAVRERRLDAVATVVKLTEREAFLEFTEIYLPTPLVIMTRSETSQIQSLKELRQLNIILVKGYSSSKQLIVQFPDLRSHYVTTPLEGLRSVASGAADAYVGVLGVNSFLAAQNGITNLKVNSAFNMADNGQRFGVRKDWPQLARLLDKALLAISLERRNVIFQRWLPRHVGEIKRLSQPSYAIRLFPWLLGCLGLALLSYFVLFIFNRRLHKAVETRTQELSRTNEKLHESEKRYRDVAEETPVLICRFLPGGEITYVNEAYCKYFEKRAEDFVGQIFLSQIPEADRETVMANISAMTVESPNQSYEHQAIGSGGEIHWQRWTHRALFDAQGKAVAYQSIGEDITERKQAEEALHVVSQLNESTINSSPIGILIFNSAGDCVAANDSAALVIGATKEQLLLQNYHQINSWKQSGLYDIALDTVKEKSKKHHEIYVNTTFGKICTLDIHLIPIRVKSEPYLLLMLDDITERKLAEEKILRFGRIFESSLNEIYLFEADTLKLTQVSVGKLRHTISLSTATPRKKKAQR